MPNAWGFGDIPDQTGRLALVTGANSGLGLVVAGELARAGARVVLACRDTAKGEAAADSIRARAAGADLEVRRLDLADLSAVREFAAEFAAAHDRLDTLVNNAGIMAVPRGTTADGFETQFGVNHLGHFALTGLLLPVLEAAPEARVVTVTSTFHAFGSIDFGNLRGEKRYSRNGAYSQSKLANLLFAAELHRRLAAVGSPARSLPAHPGWVSTNLQPNGYGPLMRVVMRSSNLLFAAPVRSGARSILCAATLPGLPGGTFVGPRSLGGYRGSPGIARPAKRAQDTELAARLWEVSEEATGVRFAFANDTHRA
ncbi:oxidoreductase [Streptomyces hoynatensis]|uniref:SDR family NAD(P)-dependent oxidoreductase n=1 Tax=Streptomyces hoynatensis TaxID=1141874 RepID=A0A3A9YWG4_9ACTN|nr:oxidoreductase [Streptomyces hoynatensis]RKN39566.1 SDR family NAD(P)-dependent oxidoreductase [Streptomyces hoynatensis]